MSDVTSSLPPHLDQPPLTVLTSPEVAAAVFGALADAVVVYDREGRIVGSNPTSVTLSKLTQPGGQAAFAIPVAERATGIDVRRLSGDSLPVEDWPVMRVLRGETLQGAQAVDVVVHTLDGRELTLNVSGAPLFDAKGRVRGAVCVSRDITERVHLEQKVAARAAEMESIFATQTEAVVFADSAGRIVHMNDAQRRLCALTGVDPAAEYIQIWAQTAAQFDALGQPILPEHRPFYRAIRGETVAGDHAVELYQRGAQGHDLVLRVSGAPVRGPAGRILGVVLATEDVTHRRRVEQELAERANQIEGVFDAMADGIILLDATGHIIRMNETQRLLVGYDAARDGAGCLFADYAARRMPSDLQHRPLPKEQWPAVRILRGERLTGADAVEIRVRALDGRELMLQISGAPMRDAAGNILGAVIAVRDVTKRHQLEDQRSDILRVVAHDLLSPITGIRLYLQMQERRLRKGQPPFLPEDEHVDTLNTNLLRMERLVRDLREMASIESGALTLERHRCDLGALCRKEVEVQEMLVPERMIHLELPEEAILAEVDEQRIGQVIANFLSNALKYSPADQPVKLTLRADKAAVYISIKDKGAGIPEAELDHIWERYHRVEGIQAHDGTQSLGLGLYICRAIVERHEGRVGVESTVGVGSTFWFTLPRVPSVSSEERTG
jgi:signal transduction histidine kinase